MAEDKDAYGPNEASFAYPGWRVTVASGIGVFVSFGSLLVYTFGIFLKPLTEEFAWSRQAVSLAFGIAAMALAAASPPLGYLIDRFGPRRIILSCLTTFGCAFASLAFLTPHIGHLYATFVVLGLVGNGAAHLAYSRVVSGWFDRRRGMALAVLMAGGALGAIVLPPAAQALIETIGWRGAFAVLGLLSLMVGLPVVTLYVRERPGLRATGTSAGAGTSVREGLRSRAFWIVVAVLFLSSISQNGAMTHLSALLTDRGVSAGEAAFVVSVMGAASLLGRLGAGWFLDRFFGPRVSFWLLAFSALGVFLLSGARSLVTGAMGAALIGFGMGGEADVIPYLLSRYFGLRSFSTLYGLTWSAYAIAAAIGPVLMGQAFDAAGSYEAFLVQLSIVTLISGGLMLLMPTYRLRTENVAAPQSSAEAAPSA
ncbi:MAG TPA: MFS transporter [Terriglobia bacterium]|nr:MFS transporter [Terriglobia bacterium]